MKVAEYFTIGKLFIRWIAATGKCIKAKQAAGETIDIWVVLVCVVDALSVLEGEIVPIIETAQYRKVK